MSVLVYDPERVSDPEALGVSLGIGVLIAGIPSAYVNAYTFPEAGYLVARETWKGLDVLLGPVTLEQIAALPDPGPDPSIQAAQVAQEQTTTLSVLQTTPIDLVELEANLEYLAVFVNNATVTSISRDTARLETLIDEMVAFVGETNPTPELAFSAIRAICENSVIVDRVALAVLADVIRYILR
jgi:hypothetical protein